MRKRIKVRGVDAYSYYTKVEYEQALKISERFREQGLIFEPAEIVLQIGTLDMQKKLLEYVKKYDGMNIVEFLNSFDEKD